MNLRVIRRICSINFLMRRFPKYHVRLLNNAFIYAMTSEHHLMGEVSLLAANSKFLAHFTRMFTAVWNFLVTGWVIL
jgi:hypothetical protein